MSDTATASETPLSDALAGAEDLAAAVVVTTDLASDAVASAAPASDAIVSEHMQSEASTRLIDVWAEVSSRWLSDSIHNSPVARSTDALNHLTASLPALRQALAEKL